jgi:hypothetical protein
MISHRLMTRSTIGELHSLESLMMGLNLNGTESERDRLRSTTNSITTILTTVVHSVNDRLLIINFFLINITFQANTLSGE